MDQSNKSSSNKPTLVGVMLTRRLIKKTFLSQDSIYRVKELIEANKIVNTNLIFFSKNDVDLLQRKVLGITYNYSESKWEFKSFPLPDVIYVRGGSGSKLRKLITKFDRMGVKKLNPIIAFNKGKLFQELNLDQNVRPYLPATESVENMGEIKAMILKLGTVYIKARRGRKGTKVMRVEKLSNNRFLYSYSVLGKLVRNRVNSMAKLEQVINDFFGKKKVIVQKAIDLARVGQYRLCDFRAEVQRNKNGEIEIVGVCIRVGQSNSPITTHANAYRYDVYLKELFPHYSQQKINELKARIHTFLMNVYTGVEKKYGKFGEIGIDFAVDRHGEIWLIECNAQSAKVSLGKAYGELARRAYINPLEYAKLISKNRSRGFYNRKSAGAFHYSSGTANRTSDTANRTSGASHHSSGTAVSTSGAAKRANSTVKRTNSAVKRRSGAAKVSGLLIASRASIIKKNHKGRGQ